jgi:hypothetical protein
MDQMSMKNQRHSRIVATETHVGMDVPDAIAYPLILRRMASRARITAAGCWEWTGFVMPNGYAEVSFRSRGIRVHRLMYVISKGPIPEGMDILHSCDNTICFNPSHLSAGTDSENIRQSVERGRHAKIQNTHCPQGHSYAEHGRLNVGTGWRACRLCERIGQRIKAGWPADLARSEPRRQGRSPIANSTWRRVPSPRVPKTHCLRGHELAGENLYMTPDGRRNCRTCHHASVRKWKPKPPQSFENDARDE